MPIGDKAFFILEIIRFAMGCLSLNLSTEGLAIVNWVSEPKALTD